MKQEQSHLGYVETINYGSFYTPEVLVSIAYDILHKNVLDFSSYKVLDTSCGYGNFLRNPNSIGADCDTVALKNAQNNVPSGKFFYHNSLLNVNRSQYDLSNKDGLIIIGNPPYNDTTSIIRSNIKCNNYEIDKDLKHRDFGISFLLSCNKLKADYVCVLHPLSYLIKKQILEVWGSLKITIFY